MDARFAIRGDLAPPEGVVIVGIDEASFTELGEQWPFPRSLHGEAIKELHRAGARVIAYDVQFTEPSNPADDQALADAVARPATSCWPPPWSTSVDVPTCSADPGCCAR